MWVGPEIRQDQQIHTNGVDFVCLTQGKGPPVLLVHGFPDSPHTWSSQIQAVSPGEMLHYIGLKRSA
jgi:pimeloyl-ACP methyl ester carboxylesterase